MKLFCLLVGSILATMSTSQDLELLLQVGNLVDSNPTQEPTAALTTLPSAEPSAPPTLTPTSSPTIFPTVEPTQVPSLGPTMGPTAAPSVIPSVVPTYAPSIVPTASPTVDTVVTFAAKQTLRGVSPRQYISQKREIDPVLKRAIAGTMTGVQPENIVEIGIDPQNLGKMETGDRLPSRRFLAVSDTPLFYVIKVNSDEVTYESLTAELTAAVSTGALAQSVQSLADDAGVTVLEEASFSEPVTVELGEEREDVGDDSGLTEGEKTGIVIGVVTGVAFLCYLAYIVTNMHTTERQSLFHQHEPVGRDVELVETRFGSHHTITIDQDLTASDASTNKASNTAIPNQV